MKNIRRKNPIAVALFSAMAGTVAPLAAQDTTNAVAMSPSADVSEPPPYRAWTIALGVGTDSIFGGGVSWRFSDHFGARAGIGYAEANWDHLGIGGLSYDATMRFTSEPLTLDYYPWKKHSFRISLGLMFNQNELSGTVSEAGTIIIDGQPIVIPPASLSMTLEQQPVNPYLSIGGNLFYFDRAHHWALAGEVGVAYTGDVQASVDRSGSSSISDDVLNSVKDELRQYADDYTWWPVAKLALTYSF